MVGSFHLFSAILELDFNYTSQLFPRHYPKRSGAAIAYGCFCNVRSEKSLFGSSIMSFVDVFGWKLSVVVFGENKFFLVDENMFNLLGLTSNSKKRAT